MKLLTLKEAAEYLRLFLPTMYRLVNAGTVPSCRVGSSWRINFDDLDRILGVENKKSDAATSPLSKEKELLLLPNKVRNV